MHCIFVYLLLINIQLFFYNSAAVQHMRIWSTSERYEMTNRIFSTMVITPAL